LFKVADVISTGARTKNNDFMNKGEMGIKGYFVSDCGAIDDIYYNRKFVNSIPEASALAVKSGTDLNCGEKYEHGLTEAVSKGLITWNPITWE
jgi:beta-glucosidase-like glycosyl hydrolase